MAPKLSTIPTRSCVIVLAALLCAAAEAGDGPHIAAGQEAAIVKQNLAAPRHYDVFYGKKDRQYLTGVWKLRLASNLLTKSWIKKNLVRGRVGRGPALKLKDGIKLPRPKIAPEAADVDPSADVSAWWDVLVPGAWNKLQPYEEPKSRARCDYYVPNRNSYAWGGVGFYRKTFRVPASKAGSRVTLHFGCVESDCVVWVNGKKVGEHRNWGQRGIGRIPCPFLDGFDLDITRAVKVGAENLLTVGVYDSGLPIVWTMPDSGGITGLVWIEYFPKAYFDTVLVTARFGAEKLRVDVRPAGPGRVPASVRVEVKPWASPDYTFPDESARAYRANVPLRTGREKGWLYFDVAVPGIAAWDVDHPALYEVRILDGNGRIMGLERFGVRTFEAKGTNFFLNGKPIFFFGENSGLGIVAERAETPGAMTKEAFNFDNLARKRVQARRRMNFNAQRVHTGPGHRNGYYFCDEVGIMVRDEWTPSPLTALPPAQTEADYLGKNDVSASFTSDRKALIPGLQERLLRWIRKEYNSPSVVTWSGGNEMGAGDPDVRLYCTLLHDFIRRHDWEQRPFTPASGLHWERGDANLRHKPLPAEYLDFHNYVMIDRRWPKMAENVNAEFDETTAIYGGFNRPVVLGEWLAHGGLEARLCPITPELFDERGDPKVEEYVGLLNDLAARRGPYKHHRVSREYLARLAVGGSRIARSRRDDAEARARYYHRSIEILRRDCPRLVGSSIHGIQDYILYALKDDQRVPYEYGSPESAALAMGYQPLIAIPDFWQKHVMASDGLACRVHVINWSRSTASGRLEVRLEGSGGKPIVSASAPFERLRIGQRLVVPIRLKTTGARPGVYTAVFDIVAGGKVVSRNKHRVLIRSKAEFARLETDKRVALWEVADGPDTAAGLMDAFGCRYRRVKDLANLSGVDVLVIGRDSLDSAVLAAGRTLRRFVERGGRILCFEQKATVPVSWAAALSLQNCGNVPNADPLRLTHPIFRGLEPLDFEDWGDTHIVHSGLIRPLGPNALATATGPRTGFAHSSPADFGMVVAEFRLGKGACLLSQLKVTANYRTDSAARAFGYNLLRYALATAWPTDDVPTLAGDTGKALDRPVLTRDKALFLRFGKRRNRTLADSDGQGWMGLREGIRDLPTGVNLFGTTLFRTETNAIVLGRSSKQPQIQFPTTTQRFWIGKRLKRLYFLHTAAWVTAKEGEPLITYTIEYSDGQKAEFPARNRVDIADWHRPTSHKNAERVWVSGKGKGVYAAVWENPNPKRKIAWLGLAAANKGFVGVLAITGELAE